MIHLGIGETQLNNLLSIINVHCIDHKSLKRRENEIAPIIKQNAKTSENNFLLEEEIGSLVIGEHSAAALKTDLEKVFQNKLLPKANQLSKLCSSQANERFNSTVASKAPKRIHYSGSASLGYQFWFAVLQKNQGYEYMSKVNKAADMSPGKETMKRAGKINVRRARKSVKSKPKECKTIRIKLKHKRLAKNVAK
ncbi:unnamed protein product [Mytilus coruscus]|uniref:Uncharacterized protein n=1 Tax=Mytilus coruscus TaxID=42192 RepID=A0A6J8AE38_MYTCO|nr:unnamed protein product [Mytilus coruscus]